ncbi:hypothetical protein [Ilumatobacter nonamiensis]|uniref:hypothetical protein n=1 Tax=Ilumatobacter nonamiensis TaxID=467093 RepID=UPI000590869B|nr:hypothetical protein [Ilumatobacter nonamiensis]
MSRRGGSSGRLALAGFAAAGFAIALVAFVSAQLALMSVLDANRAERAAAEIAASRFAADVIDQTVTNAIAPIAGESIAQQAAAVASNDPTVIRVVETSLLDAHRQIVDRDAPDEVVDGNVAVGSAIVTSVADTAAANGIDVGALGLGDPATLDSAAIATEAGLPDVVPDDLPRLGLRDVAETTRTIALVAMLVFAAIAVLAHPRPGRSLRGIGMKVAIVTGAWLVALLVIGWVIGLVSNTLFGEMLDAVWFDAVPSMLFLVGAGVAIGIALVFAGISVDGFSRELQHRHTRYEDPYPY